MVKILQEVWGGVFIFSDSGFQVCPLRLNLVEVRWIGRKEENMGTFFFNSLSCLWRLMKSAVVQDYPIVLFKSRDKTFSNPGIKNRRVCMALESKGRLNFLLAISGNDSGSGMSYFSWSLSINPSPPHRSSIKTIPFFLNATFIHPKAFIRRNGRHKTYKLLTLGLISFLKEERLFFRVILYLFKAR